jgi:stress response protein YsnF
MKLTQKDRDFLERLKLLLESKDLSVDMKEDGYKRLVLRQNYGDKIESTFRMSRQGVRWRFSRLFNEVYVSAYETIYMMENHFGIQLRQQALAIAKERVEMRKKNQKIGDLDVCRRQSNQEVSHPPGSQL